MSGMYDGNLAALDEHESRNERWLKSRPLCEKCYEPIQDDHYYEWGDRMLCESCMEEELRKYSLQELTDMAWVDTDEIKFELIQLIMKDVSRWVD